MSNTELVIGNVTLTHEVTEIQCYEAKAVEPVQALRTSDTYIVDHAESTDRVHISLVFNVDNPNLSSLVALFRTCPITTLQNEQIKSVWQEYTPAALEQFMIRTVPDLVDTVQVDLVASVVDVHAFVGEKDLIYIIPVNSVTSKGSRDPRNCIFLNKWTEKLSQNGKKINRDNFHKFIMELNSFNTLLEPVSILDLFEGEEIDHIIGEDGQPKEVRRIADLHRINLISEEDADIHDTNVSPGVKITSMSSSINNYFGYSKILGKHRMFPMHIGSSSRNLSIEITVDTNSSRGRRTMYKLQSMKRVAGKLSKHIDRKQRLIGWNITTGILNLLAKQLPELQSYPNIFVPVTISTVTTDIPGIKKVSIDFIETNMRFVLDQEVLLSRGGKDYANLKKFFDVVAEEEDKYRKRLTSSKDKNEILKAMVSMDPEVNTEVEAFRLFWPSGDKFGAFLPKDIKRLDDFGFLNRDTLRATFLSPTFDRSGTLVNALRNSVTAVTSVKLPSHPISFVDRLPINFKSVTETLFGIGRQNSEIAIVYDALLESVKRAIVFPSLVSIKLGRGTPTLSNEETEYRYAEIAYRLLIGLFGDYRYLSDFSSESGQLVQILASSDISFTQDFKDSLFETIVQRSKTPDLLDYVYSVQGISTAYYKMLLAYNDIQMTQGNNYFGSIGRDPLETKREQSVKKSTYPDIPLPTYQWLFGEDWKEYAPTFDDLGIVGINSIDQIPDIDNLNNRDAQKLPAVDAEDTVHPAIWFRDPGRATDGTSMGTGGNSKDALRNLIKNATETTSSVMNSHTISIPYEIEEVKQIEHLYKKLEESEKKGDTKKANIFRETLSATIESGFIRFREQDISGFEREIDSLAQIYGNKKDAVIPSTVYLYTSYKENFIQKRRLTYPGIGGEMYRLSKEKSYIEPTDRYPTLSTDSEYKNSSRDDTFSFVRHTEENTEATLNSSLDQIQDMHTYRRMFPTIKIYLLDFRGEDVFADDGFFDINAVLSVDVTQDKDDADLAVIRLADPLYNIQSSSFGGGNVETYGKYAGSEEERLVEAGTPSLISKVDKIVYANLKGTESIGGFIKRFKVTQGRGIMIKMGYDSCAKNLKTVFTGRINEILPGDVLTLICQGWKTELINRQVAFWNEDPNSWGARDLAIQAIVKAQPFGFGEHYVERDTNFILRNIRNLDIAAGINRALHNTQTVVTDEYGTLGILEGIGNSLKTFAGFGSSLKRDTGVDTRLKNIWYPDAPDHDNVLGIRSALGVMPSWQNDSWIVPIKPCWEVLKEASRHAWNCIVQVVPYDGRATLFMGHPDQPYYFSNGDPGIMNKWSRYSQARNEKNTDVRNELYDKFKQSKEYNSLVDAEATLSHFTARNNSIVNKYLRDTLSKVNILTDNLSIPNSTSYIPPSYRVVKYLTKQKILIGSLATTSFDNLTISQMVSGKILKSTLPQDIYLRVKRDRLGEVAPLFFVSLYFDIPITDLSSAWSTISSDILKLLDDQTKPELEKIADIIPESIQLSGFESDKKRIIEEIKDISLNSRQILQTSSLSVPLIYYANIEQDPLLDQFTNKIQGVIVNTNRFIRSYNILKPKFKDQKVYNEGYIFSEKAILSAIDRILEEVSIKNKPVIVTNISSFAAIDISRVGVLLRDLQTLLSFINVDLSSKRYLDQGWDQNQSLKERVKSDIVGFKTFVYFFGSFLLNDTNEIDLSGLVGSNYKTTPPNMQVFRLHHWIDDKTDIIQNNIVASTKEMWNTVVIEHPAKGEVDDFVEDTGEVFNTEKINAGVQWEYYPKNEVTGVLGLQFHPGLTLANKKIKVCTELNCVNPELSTKLACTHLAEGLRKMYRGNLIFTGRFVKPHDRIILKDNYTSMHGPLEVESVIHSWNLETGWTTSIVPQLVADANPGAAIFQTASLEATYNIIFNSIDYISEALTYAIILGTLGGGVSLRVSQFNIPRAISSIGKGVASPVQTFLSTINTAYNTAIGAPGAILKGGKTPILSLINLVKRYGGPLKSYIVKETVLGVAGQALNIHFKLNVVQGFIKSSRELKKLPVIISPLMYEGRPFLAGLETDSAIWDIFSADAFYSSRDMQRGAEKVLESIRDYIGLDPSTTTYQEMIGTGR